MSGKKVLPFDRADLSPWQMFVVESLIKIEGRLSTLDARTGAIALLCGLVGGALVVWGKL